MSRWLLALQLRRFGQAGFSLIEMVVGLALLSFAVALMPGGIRLGLHAWSARGDIERSAGFAMVLDALQERIEQALPVVERGADGSVRIQFEGDATMIEFVGAAETGPQGAGVYRTRIAPNSQDQARPAGLAMEMHVHLPRANPPANSMPFDKRVLAGDVATFRFRYFGASGARAMHEWHETWRREDAMPLLVEINAEMPTESKVYKRRLVVVLRTAPRS